MSLVLDDALRQAAFDIADALPGSPMRLRQESDVHDRRPVHQTDLCGNELEYADRTVTAGEGGVNDDRLSAAKICDRGI